MSNVSDLIENYADTAVIQMKRILMQNRKRSTGTLVNSINYSVEGTLITFKYKNYGEFVKSGRKAGSRMPPINAILAWMKVKRISTGNNRSKSLVKKGKNQPREKQLLRTAFAISKSIGKNGIAPLDFTTPLEIFQTTKFKSELKIAITKDLKEQMTKNNK